MQYIARPMSRRDIRHIAYKIRKKVGAENALYFDIMKFVELQLPIIMPDFTLEVVEERLMGDDHGKTFPNQKLIQLRQDVYDRALANSGRDRLTVAHEVFHLMEHNEEDISFARKGDGEIKPYMNPEWQANAFGGELLIPHHLIGGLSINDIILQCGVSADAARYQINKY